MPALRFLRRTLPLFAAVLLAAPSALASVVLPASLETLARRADLVVRGRAERSFARVSRDGKTIHTVTAVRVASTLKGQANEVVEVRTPGGTVGDITQVVHGAPSFEEGEEVVLFLKRETAARCSVEGLALGKFSVVKADGGLPVVRQKAAGLQILQPDGRLVPARALQPLPERDFLERVRRAIEAAAQEVR